MLFRIGIGFLDGSKKFRGGNEDGPRLEPPLQFERPAQDRLKFVNLEVR